MREIESDRERESLGVHVFERARMNSILVAFAASLDSSIPDTGWCRVIGCLFFIGDFLQKSPMISGSFV